MAITISGENNNDKILASDGVIDQISGINFSGIITASHINVGSNIQLGNAGIVTATTFVGNVTGNVNSTSPLLLQTGGSERFRITGNNELGIAGGNYGSSGQVLTSGGSGSAVSWTTIPTQVTIANNANNRVITGGSGINLNGEANLTFDGSKLIAIQTNSDIGLLVQNTTHDSQLRIEAQAANKNSVIMFADGTDGDVGMIDYDHNDNSLSFTVNTSKRLRIDSTGNLTFTGPSNSFATIQYASNFTKLDLRGNGIANSYHYILSYGAGHGEADNFHMVNKTTNGNLVFRTGSSTDERLTITSAGVVDVTGSIIVDDPGGGTGLSMNGVSGQTCGVVRQRDDMQHAIIFRGSSNADGSTITGGNTMEYREYGDHVFKTGAINQHERLRIASDSNITQTIDTDGDGFIITAGDMKPMLTGNSNRSAEGNTIFGISGKWNNTEVGRIAFEAGADTTNKDDGKINLYTRVSGGSLASRLSITSSGTVQIAANGNLYIVGGGSYNASLNGNILSFDRAGYSYIDQTSNSGTLVFRVGASSANMLRLDTQNAYFPNGTLFLGTQNTSSGHINAYENMSFNIDTDNDDTNRYFSFHANGNSASGTELLRITESGNTRIGVPPTTGSSSLIAEKQATIGTKHFYTVYHNFSSTNSPLAVNSKIPHPACGTVEVVAGWSNGNGLRYSKFHWTSSGSTSGCVQIFTTTANRYGVSVSIGTPTMSISGDYTNFSFTFSDTQGSKMEKLKIHFEYFNQFRIDG